MAEDFDIEALLEAPYNVSTVNDVHYIDIGFNDLYDKQQQKIRSK